MLTAGNGIGAIIETSGHGLARGSLVQAGDGRFDVAGQPGAFQQALGVDHQVVAGVTQALLELAPFAIFEGLPEVLAPATDGHRDHVGDRRMPGRNLGEALFHHPVELDARQRAHGVGQRGQGVDHVAQ